MPSGALGMVDDEESVARDWTTILLCQELEALAFYR
jgi:hypothetical protein